jgi:hypothetical protein
MNDDLAESSSAAERRRLLDPAQQRSARQQERAKPQQLRNALHDAFRGKAQSNRDLLRLLQDFVNSNKAHFTAELRPMGPRFASWRAQGKEARNEARLVLAIQTLIGIGPQDAATLLAYARGRSYERIDVPFKSLRTILKVQGSVDIKHVAHRFQDLSPEDALNVLLAVMGQSNNYEVGDSFYTSSMRAIVRELRNEGVQCSGDEAFLRDECQPFILSLFTKAGFPSLQGLSEAERQNALQRVPPPLANVMTLELPKYTFCTYVLYALGLSANSEWETLCNIADQAERPNPADWRRPVQLEQERPAPPPERGTQQQLRDALHLALGGIGQTNRDLLRLLQNFVDRNKADITKDLRPFGPGFASWRAQGSAARNEARLVFAIERLTGIAPIEAAGLLAYVRGRAYERIGVSFRPLSTILNVQGSVEINEVARRLQALRPEDALNVVLAVVGQSSNYEIGETFFTSSMRAIVRELRNEGVQCDTAAAFSQKECETCITSLLVNAGLPKLDGLSDVQRRDALASVPPALANVLTSELPKHSFCNAVLYRFGLSVTEADWQRLCKVAQGEPTLEQFAPRAAAPLPYEKAWERICVLQGRGDLRNRAHDPHARRDMAFQIAVVGARIPMPRALLAAARLDYLVYSPGVRDIVEAANARKELAILVGREGLAERGGAAALKELANAAAAYAASNRSDAWRVPALVQKAQLPPAQRKGKAIQHGMSR